MRVNPRLEQEGPDLDVVFDVHEGTAQTIGPVEIRGLRRTRERLVRAQLTELEPGQPLDPRKLANAERRLRDLGIFRRVVVTASPDAVAAITVEVEEAAPYNVAYDVRYNQEDAFNRSVDGQVQNLFGRAITLGARVQAGRWIREGRFSVHLPSVWRLRDMTVSVFDLRQTIRTAFGVSGSEPPPLDVGERLEQGVQLQQSVHRFHPFEILYGYRYRRLTCPGQGFPPVDSSIRGIVDPCDRESLQGRLRSVRSPYRLTWVPSTRRSCATPVTVLSTPRAARSSASTFPTQRRGSAPISTISASSCRPRSTSRWDER